MQGRQDFARKQILLIRQYLGAGIPVIAQKRVDKCPLTGRRFKKTPNLDAGIFQSIRNGVNDRSGSIERRQHRGFERIHVPGKLLVIL